MAVGNENFFGSIADRYDSLARRGMPRRDEMLDKLLSMMPEQADDVLELGCGTGALTVRLAARYPGARLMAVDGAQEMVALARERLLKAGIRPTAGVSFGTYRFDEIDLPRRRYDLIASNMSLHHVKDKVPFYARLWEALTPGGLLVLGDELKGALSHIEELHWNGWLDFARQPEHLTEDEISEIIRHVEQEDHYETLPEQLSLLKLAGFVGIDCTWRYLNYAVFVAGA